jgi:hypothetical protein
VAEAQFEMRGPSSVVRRLLNLYIVTYLKHLNELEKEMLLHELKGKLTAAAYRYFDVVPGEDFQQRLATQGYQIHSAIGFCEEVGRATWIADPAGKAIGTGFYTSSEQWKHFESACVDAYSQPKP